MASLIAKFTNYVRYLSFKIHKRVKYYDGRVLFMRANGASINDAIIAKMSYSKHITDKFIEIGDKNEPLIIIGANIGTTARNLATFFSNIIAVEADFENFQVLRENSFGATLFWPLHLALGDTGSILPLHKNPYSNGRNSFVRSYSDEVIEYVPVLPLDALGIKPVLMLIDVEGFEIEVLSGAKRSLETVKAAAIEVSFKEGKDISKLVNILRENFDKVEFYDGKSWIETSFDQILAQRETNIMCDYFVSKA